MKTKKLIHFFLSFCLLTSLGALAQTKTSSIQKLGTAKFVNHAKPGFLVVNYSGDWEDGSGMDAWGLIDYNGDFIFDGESQWISPIYSINGNMTFSNSDGFSIYGEKGKGYGVVNRDNMVVVKPGFSQLNIFDKYCVAEDSVGTISIIHLPSLTVVEKFKPDFSVNEVEGVSDGRILVCKGNSGFTFYDMKGNTVIPSERLKGYYDVGSFHEGRAAVIKEVDGETLCGYIDETGREVIPTKFMYDDSWGLDGMSFSNGRVNVSDVDGNEMVIDPEGKKIADGYDSTLFHEDGFDKDLIPAWDETTGLNGYEDKNGKIVIRPVYEMAGEFYHGYALVEIDGKISLIDKTGKVILKDVGEEVFVVG